MEVVAARHVAEAHDQVIKGMAIQPDPNTEHSRCLAVGHTRRQVEPVVQHVGMGLSEAEQNELGNTVAEGG